MSAVTLENGSLYWVSVEAPKLPPASSTANSCVKKAKGKHHVRSGFRFGILIAGRAPLVSLDFASNLRTALPSAAEITDSPDLKKREYDGSHVLRVPTVHLHESRDKGCISINTYSNIFVILRAEDGLCRMVHTVCHSSSMRCLPSFIISVSSRNKRVSIEGCGQIRDVAVGNELEWTSSVHKVVTLVNVAKFIAIPKFRHYHRSVVIQRC
jgi:hypothetical protein